MPKKLRVEGPSTPEEVVAARKQASTPREYERLLAIEMAEQGRFRIEDIAYALGRGHATIERWLRTFREGGLAALTKRRQKTRNPALKADDVQALENGLREGQFKRAKEIRKWLKDERGIEMSRWGVYYWLGKVKARHKVPRRVHEKQDPDQRQAFRDEIGNKLEALDLPSDKRVRIWVEDEHRYGLISTLRRCWTLHGHRVRVPVHQKYEWGYVYGAADLVSGDAQFLYLPTVSLAMSEAFIEQLVATDPDALHVLLWDQAGFHPKAKLHPLPDSVRIIEFPAYCPELNPMETLWDMVKCAVSNEVWETLTAIEAAITEELRPFWESVERVWQLLGDNWLTRAVATFLKQREALI
jgi:transposase